MRVLVVCAVADEGRAVMRHLGEAVATAVGPYRQAARTLGAADDPIGPAPTTDIITVVSGVGEAASAAATATALAIDPSIGLVVSAGIAGGISVRAPIGGVVVADRIVAADLGAEEPGSPGVRIPLSALGYDGGVVEVPDGLVRRAAAFTDAVVGTILTVSTVTASEERIKDFTRAHPEALAEAMEGHGVAVAASAHGVPMLEVRTISNPVGVRDPKDWDIEGALDALADAMHALLGDGRGTSLAAGA
jgi:futalosine hydrolase